MQLYQLWWRDMQGRVSTELFDTPQQRWDRTNSLNLQRSLQCARWNTVSI